MNDLGKFNASSAEAFADIAKKKYNDRISQMASRYIRVIESKYEKKIKKAIMKDPSVREIRIDLPLSKRPISVKEADLVENEMNDYLRERGFRVVLSVPSYCDCIFNSICLDKEFYASFKW